MGRWGKGLVVADAPFEDQLGLLAVPMGRQVTPYLVDRNDSPLVLPGLLRDTEHLLHPRVDLGKPAQTHQSPGLERQCLEITRTVVTRLLSDLELALMLAQQVVRDDEVAKVERVTSGVFELLGDGDRLAQVTVVPRVPSEGVRKQPGTGKERHPFPE